MKIKLPKFNELFVKFHETYKDNHDIIFFEIIFALSKKISTKDDFVKLREEEIDFDLKKYELMLKQYFVMKMPLAHVIGHTTFLGLDFVVSKKVLCPRDITEQMVKDFILIHKDDSEIVNVVDLCCGCGCIGISIKKFCSILNVTCIDKYWAPFLDTMQNAKKQLTPITVDKQDAIKYLSKFNNIDIIISNPPYINAANFHDKYMFKFESKKALIAKENGMYFYRRYFQWLSKNTFRECWLEVGYDLFENIKKELSLYPNLKANIFEDKGYIIVVNK